MTNHSIITEKLEYQFYFKKTASSKKSSPNLDNFGISNR